MLYTHREGRFNVRKERFRLPVTLSTEYTQRTCPVRWNNNRSALGPGCRLGRRSVGFAQTAGHLLYTVPRSTHITLRRCSQTAPIICQSPSFRRLPFLETLFLSFIRRFCYFSFFSSVLVSFSFLKLLFSSCSYC